MQTDLSILLLSKSCYKLLRQDATSLQMTRSDKPDLNRFVATTVCGFSACVDKYIELHEYIISHQMRKIVGSKLFCIIYICLS